MCKIVSAYFDQFSERNSSSTSFSGKAGFTPAGNITSRLPGLKKTGLA